MTKSEVLNVRISGADKARALALADQRGLTLSEVARRALTRGLRELERRARPTPSPAAVGAEEPAA